MQYFSDNTARIFGILRNESLSALLPDLAAELTASMKTLTTVAAPDTTGMNASTGREFKVAVRITPVAFLATPSPCLL